MPQFRRASSARIPTPYGEFDAYCYSSENVTDFEGHLVCLLGNLEQEDAPLVRIQSECLTGDVLGSQRCDCGQQLHQSLEMISQTGSGILIYLRGQEGRGIGLLHKLRAYELQDQGFDTVDANLEQGFAEDLRDYKAVVDILNDIKVKQIKLMTNNPKKLNLDGIQVVERIPLETTPTTKNKDYLKTKRDRMGHLLSNL